MGTHWESAAAPTVAAAAAAAAAPTATAKPHADNKKHSFTKNIALSPPAPSLAPPPH